MAEVSYINGSDLLLKVGGKCVGHCTSHTVTFNSDSKDHSVKPEASKSKGVSLWKGKSVTGMSISINFEGLQAASETENGYMELAALWGAGKPVEVAAFERENDSAPYLQGMFIIDSLEQTMPAQDDVTYTGSLSNVGEPEKYPGKPSTESIGG